MKILKFLLAAAAASMCLAACEDEGSGAGDATVSFGNTEYTFSENAGSVTIPLVFTGEPKKYPIILNISASVDGGASISDVVHFVQQIGSLRYNGNGDLAVEMEIVDNYTQNEDVALTLEIVSADGAEIVGGTTVVTITDNDASLFESLQGNWYFYAMRDGSTPVTFPVVIDTGETQSEIAENTEKQRLRLLGFGGYGYSDDEYEIPFAWYVDVVTDEETGEQSLRTVPDIPLINHPGNPFPADEGKFTQVTVMLYWESAGDIGNLNPDFSISAEVSDDLTTITFDQDAIITPVIIDDGDISNFSIWAMLYSCTMERM